MGPRWKPADGIIRPGSQMNRWPVFLCIAFPFFLVGVLVFRLRLYGDAGLNKPDGDLADPDDLTLTKLRLNEPRSSAQAAERIQK